MKQELRPPTPSRRSLRDHVPDRLRWGSGGTRTQLLAGIKNILVPIDFSRPSIEAVRFASLLAKDYGATLHVVFVYEPMMIVDGLESCALVRSTEQMVKVVTAQLARFVQEEIDELIPTRNEVRIGKPYREIVEAAKDRRADLIVIATHGYTGLKHAFVGSTAGRVVRHASCPVLVVRERQRE